MKIGGRLARLCSIYVNVTGGGLFPDVHYIDIYGEDLETVGGLVRAKLATGGT